MKNFIVISIILLLCACSGQNIRPDKLQYQGLPQAQAAYQQRDYFNAAMAYQQLFQRYGNDDFAVLAADSWIQINELDKAKQLIFATRTTTNPLLKLIQAQLSLDNNNIALASQYLQSIEVSELDPRLMKRYLTTKAQISDNQQDYLSAALAWIELSSLSGIDGGMNDSIDVNDNIINSLLQVNEQELEKHLFDPEISDLQLGWLEAAYISYTSNNNDISQWKKRWQDHPAQLIFSQTQQYKNIAVLLPLSGKYKNIAKSIQQGMIAALYRDNSQQQLNFFDTGSNGEHFSFAWFGAIESGAEFIIGPLEKNSIQQLTQYNSSTVPVLLLNSLTETDNTLGIYQFSLSQDDDVISAANRLIAEQKKRIMLLAPESEMGRKLAVSFEQQFNSQGGQVISYEFYPESTHDYSREIKKALGLNDSQVRARRLQTLISTPIKSAPQIRPDIDAIYVIAKPKQARLIKPQLKFYQADDVPVFATSQVLSSNTDTVLNKDLNGIKFSHSGFVIDPASLQEVLNFDTSLITEHKKFFAFGYDAVSIFPRLEWMQRAAQQKVNGMTGQLSVDANGVVHRELAWAQFVNGQPRLLPPIPAIKVMNDASNTTTEEKTYETTYDNSEDNNVGETDL